MALETVTNQASSTSTSKKTKKKEGSLSTTTPEEESAITLPTQAPPSDTATIPTGTPDASQDSPYIRELQKNVRNVTKKLAAMHKLDLIIAENPNTSLEELVNTRKINNDQKAQALKKPALQAQLVQLEDQIVQFKKFENEFRAQVTKERKQREEIHRRELEDLRTTAKAEATAEGSQATRQKLLTLSKFLRAAAARRQLEDDLSEESRAFEGLLLLLYGGDSVAVDAAEKLITGSDQGVPSTDDQLLNVTYSKIKELSEAYAPFAAEEAWRQEVAEAEQTDAVPAAATGSQVVPTTDPTVAHAGLTELNALPSEEAQQPSHMEPGNIDSGAANVAASTWDTNASSATMHEPMTGSWTHISRDTLEAESPAAETLPTNGTQSWADDSNEASAAAAAAVAAATSTAAPPGDGFHEVHHGRNAGRSRGGFERGGRGRGGFRGDGSGHRGRGGFRGERSGEFRGRGRGGAGAGGSRGAPRGSA